MNPVAFLNAVRERIHARIGFTFLNVNNVIEATEGLKARLPPSAGCLDGHYHFFGSSVDGTYWCVWKLDDDYKTVGYRGWLMTSVREKYTYGEEDVLELVEEVFRINTSCLCTPLGLLLDGFASAEREHSCP
jgi:hypothetical protein